MKRSRWVRLVKCALVLELLYYMDPQIAIASVCEDLGGSIIFRDTLYGAGTGLVLTGLTLMATRDEDYRGQKLAAGSLAGASIGVVYGMVESFSRPNCDKRASSASSRRISPLLAFSETPHAGRLPVLGLSFETRL